MHTRRTLGCLVTIPVIVAILVGCVNQKTEEAVTKPPPYFILSTLVQPTARPTPTPFILTQLFDPKLDLKAGPIDLPLELQIPILNVNAPILGVGLTAENAMDAPKGPIGDPIWHSAFWYRGSGIPGEPGTATITAHVNDPLGNPEIFAHLGDLRQGDLIIIHIKGHPIEFRYVVDDVTMYSLKESSDPAVLEQIYGIGPVIGIGPQPATDGLSHLTLITCAGNIVNGQFDHHTVVFATRIN
jgi:hypothetical protein